MLGYERRAHIRRLLAARGQVSVTELSEMLSVSPSTVRRDLGRMVNEGLAERHHGGAVASKAGVATSQPPLRQRASEQLEEKRRIGQATAAMVQDGHTLFLTGGTTTMHVAAQLRGRQGLTVITNALNIANMLADDPEITIIVIGGLLRKMELFLVGPIAEKALDGLRADMIIMSMRGIDPELGLTNDTLLESANDQRMIECASKLVIVADHTKFGRVAPAFVAPASAMDVLVTDSDAPEDILEELRESGVRVVVV
jgi:DeoR family transcriptional regulator of aga operon